MESKKLSREYDHLEAIHSESNKKIRKTKKSGIINHGVKIYG